VIVNGVDVEGPATKRSCWPRQHNHQSNKREAWQELQRKRDGISREVLTTVLTCGGRRPALIYGIMRSAINALATRVFAVPTVYQCKRA